jgi:hypothetical protein
MKKIEDVKVKFKKWNCELEVGYYNQGRVALTLIGAAGTKEEGEPIATCTVNLAKDELAPGHVHIKEWSGNEGMTEALVIWIMRLAFVRELVNSLMMVIHQEWAHL